MGVFDGGQTWALVCGSKLGGGLVSKIDGATTIALFPAWPIEKPFI